MRLEVLLELKYVIGVSPWFLPHPSPNEGVPYVVGGHSQFVKSVSYRALVYISLEALVLMWTCLGLMVPLGALVLMLHLGSFTPAHYRVVVNDGTRHVEAMLHEPNDSGSVLHQTTYQDT